MPIDGKGKGPSWSEERGREGGVNVINRGAGKNK